MPPLSEEEEWIIFDELFNVEDDENEEAYDLPGGSSGCATTAGVVLLLLFLCGIASICFLTFASTSPV
ncbi:MAG: hypothetical protein Kow0077_32250 [Anaerolineae bacterium]